MSPVITAQGERITVRFPARPTCGIISDLRRAGFAWSPRKRHWYGLDSADARQTLASLNEPPSVSRNTLLHGDCISVLPQLPAACADFVLTDPPYLVNYRDARGRTVLNDRDGAWLGPAFREIARVMKPDTLLLSFYGWQAADAFLTAWREAGLVPVDHMVAYKDYASSTRYFRRRHEQAYLLAKGNPPRPRRPLGDIRAHWPYTGNRHHPTEKPVGGLRPLIESLCPQGGLVLDPFAGSGSTGMAALSCGRRFLGIELDADNHAVAVRRLNSAQA